MLANLKTRFERNLIYVRPGADPPGLGSEGSCLPASWGCSGRRGFLLLVPDLWHLV